MTRYALAQQLADQVDDEMVRQGMTQAELARLAGFSQKHVSQMLTGKATGTVEAWDRLAEALGTDWVVGL